MSPTSVLIADDHAVVRDGLRILIGTQPDLRIAGEAANGHQALAMVRKLKPDVVLMDFAMPECNGAKATREITRQAPTAKVLVLSAFQDDESVRAMLESGATGYLSKQSAAQDLLHAIREVKRGNRYFSPAIARRLAQQQALALAHGNKRRSQGELTRRQVEVVKLIAQGMPNKQIAGELGLSIKTVEKHRQSAMEKLDVHDTAGLTRHAMSRGWVPVPHQPVTNLR